MHNGNVIRTVLVIQIIKNIIDYHSKMWMGADIITNLLISRCDNFTVDKRKHNLSCYNEIVWWDFRFVFRKERERERERERAESRSCQVIKRYGSLSYQLTIYITINTAHCLGKRGSAAFLGTSIQTHILKW